jgi:hypothetical protein
VFADSDQGTTKIDSLLTVEMQGLDGCPADGSFPNDDLKTVTPLEVG